MSTEGLTKNPPDSWTNLFVNSINAGSEVISGNSTIGGVITQTGVGNNTLTANTFANGGLSTTPAVFITCQVASTGVAPNFVLNLTGAPKSLRYRTQINAPGTLNAGQSLTFTVTNPYQTGQSTVLVNFIVSAGFLATAAFIITTVATGSPQQILITNPTAGNIAYGILTFDLIYMY